jgi:hypothetical protein
MPRKVYDIKPPKVVKKAEKEVKEFLSSEHVKIQRSAVKRKAALKKETQNSKWRTISAVSAVVVILLATFLYFNLQRVNVQIWPKVEMLSYEQTVKVDKTADSVDSEQAIIPAQFFEEEKSASQQFPAAGNASNEGQATGTITIYNKYDPPSAFTLKAGTHFLSDSGKYFITQEKVVIPAAKKTGSKITPGSIQAKVKAVEGGEGYNIGPAAFSIPKLSGTNYYYSIYAQSTSAMAGGYTGKVKKVTDDDIAQAKDALTKKLIADAQASLKTKVSSDYILLDSPDTFDIVNAETDTKSGAATDNFTYQATVKVKALALKKSDLDKFAKDYILSQMPENNTLQDSSYKEGYTLKSVDTDKGTAMLDVSFSSGVYRSIDKNSLALSLMGKDANQIKQTIDSELGDSISNVKIKLWPFWVAKAPSSQKSIKIDLSF